MKNEKNIIRILSALLFITGMVFWITGFGGTNLNEYVPWGLYIAFFLFFEALCVGSLFLASFSIGKNRMILAGIGTASGIGTALAILPDIGDPLASWRMFFSPNVSAPVLLDVWFLSIAIIFGFLLFLGLKRDNQNLIKVSSWILRIDAILLPLGTALLFTSLPGKVGWSSTLEIGIFLIQPLVAGTLLLILLGHKSRVSTTVGAALLLANLTFIIGEIGLAFYNTGLETIPMRELVSGSYAGLFWLALVAGVVIPSVLLFLKKSLAIAAVLGLAGVFINKFLYIVKGNLFPFLNHGESFFVPSQGEVVDGFQKALTYVPTFGEWMVSIGVVALVVLLVSFIPTGVDHKESGRLDKTS